MSQQGRLVDIETNFETLTGNSGGAVSPDGAGNITVVGAAPINIVGNPGTNTLTVDTDGTLATTYTTDSGNATPAADVINILGGTNVTTSGAGSTVTITATGSLIVDVTALDTTDTPYTVLSTDYYLSCDVSAGVLTIDLFDAPATGRVIIIKDSGGDAAANNITVTTTGGAVSIDGSLTFVMNTAFQASSFLFNGNSWEIF